METLSKRSCTKLNFKRNFPSKGRIASHLPNNPVSRLINRELGGVHKHHRHSVLTQIYQKLPGRLCFSIRSLVHESVLHDGHVFLGFTKNGNFVLSYTLHVEQDEQTAYPVHVYHLQWWHFVPYKKLRKVSEVRLFGEEGIQQELFLTVCEWPTMDTKIVVHGYCNPCDDEEKHQCYVTITATPPVGPCDECSQLMLFSSQNGGSYRSENPPRCLLHACTVHAKYELAPPYPVFAPRVFLKLDGVVLVNTGDSLVALNAHIEDGHVFNGIDVLSPRVAQSESYPSSSSSSVSTDGETQEKTIDEDSLMDSGSLLASCLPSGLSSPSHSAFQQHSHPIPRDATNTSNCYVHELSLRDKQPFAGKENLLNKQLGSSHSSCDNGDRSVGRFCDAFHGNRHDPASNNLSSGRLLMYKTSLDVYNFEAGTPKKEEDSSGESSGAPVAHDYSGACQPVRSVRPALSLASCHLSTHVRSSSEERELVFQNGPHVEDKCDVHDIFEKPCLISRLQSRDVAPLTATASTQPRILGGLSILSTDSAAAISRGISLSPGFGKFEYCGSSTCSSCISSPIVLQDEAQCFTYSVRRFVQSPGNQRPESPVDLEDDLNLAYHSLLPLEIRGANYCNMKLISKQDSLSQMPCVVVKQLTLDIEHYLGEAVKMHAEWKSRYLAFTDYDIQILEVCPESGMVIAFVYVLIRARPPTDSQAKHTHRTTRPMPRLYQTGIKFVWNLQTGLYNTIGVGDLVEVSQNDVFRTKQWHPGKKVCNTLRRRFMIPQNHHSLINVLTNEAVFRGQSLKMLLAREHYSAILL